MSGAEGGMGSAGAAGGYDFRRCKFCGATAARPAFPVAHAQLYACPCCDFHYLDRLDSPPEGTADEAPDAGERAYIEERLAGNGHLLAGRLEWLAGLAPLEGRSCLDVGTGVGQFLQLLAAAGADARGIEPSPLRRHYARQRFGLELDPRPLENPCWQEGFAGQFDLVTLWDVLEHVNFPRETLAAAWRVLKPGGVLALDTPSRDSSWYRLGVWLGRRSRGRAPLFLDSYYPAGPFGHKQIFRPQQLLRLLVETGFVPVFTGTLRPRGEHRPPKILHRLPAAGRFRDKLLLACRKPE